MKISLKKLVITEVICFLIFTTILILLICGKLTFQYHGIAVDKNQNLYLAADYVIKVYQGEKTINEIAAKKNPSGGYFFTIEDEKIILCRNEKIYTMDLNGNILNVSDDKYMKKSNEIYNRSTSFESSEGSVYSLKKTFGYYKVVKRNMDGSSNTVFKMPLSDYLCKFLMNLSLYIFLASTACIVVLTNGKKRT